MKTAIQELIEDLKTQKKNYRSGDFKTCVQLCIDIAEEKLKKEEEIQRNKCIEFSKYIRNGKDHFNNGYSTEMVYDEWVEKYSDSNQAER